MKPDAATQQVRPKIGVTDLLGSVPMRKPIVFTNIADQATDEAFNTQVRQFINFLVERIDEMINCFHEFDEHEIQSELRDTASEALKQYQLRWRILDYLAFWDSNFDGFAMLELVESCLLLALRTP